MNAITEVHSLADAELMLPNLGYIAGDADGIVTIGGVPARREMVVFNMDLSVHSRFYSLDNGHYLLNNLDPNVQYLVMVRDLPPKDSVQRYEPFCWDYVVPMNDKTQDEQMQMWQTWQT